ncbi:MAG: GNAT family N-acetyltransferase [Eubacteriales bacterium]|nr:GNAT family N-acetyltransferase [Eubacteriales bacterium]
MEKNTIDFKRIGMNEIEMIKDLFFSVFTTEPWNDDWSDQKQLDLYLQDLVGQSNSLTYGLFEDDKLVGVSMGHIKHWYSGTEYYIEELFVQTSKQGNGIGTYFLKEIEKGIKNLGLVQIFLQTESTVPAYDFYIKNGFSELNEHVSFVKKI